MNQTKMSLHQTVISHTDREAKSEVYMCGLTKWDIRLESHSKQVCGWELMRNPSIEAPQCIHTV